MVPVSGCKANSPRVTSFVATRSCSAGPSRKCCTANVDGKGSTVDNLMFLRTCVLMKMGADDIAHRAICSCSSSWVIASHIIPVLQHRSDFLQVSYKISVQMQWLHRTYGGCKHDDLLYLLATEARTSSQSTSMSLAATGVVCVRTRTVCVANKNFVWVMPPASPTHSKILVALNTE